MFVKVLGGSGAGVAVASIAAKFGSKKVMACGLPFSKT